MQVDIKGAQRPLVENAISSNKNYTESICEISYCSVHSTNRFEAHFWLSSSETLFLYKLQVDILNAKGPIVEKGISPKKNHTEAFCESCFCSVHSNNRVEAYFWLSSSETLFL